MIIRPSSKGDDHLTITVKFHPEIYLNIDVREDGRTEQNSIGQRLMIEDVSGPKHQRCHWQLEKARLNGRFCVGDVRRS